MKLTTRGLIAFALTLFVGIGGALGAEALEAGGLAELILSFAGGLLAGLSFPAYETREQEEEHPDA